LKYWHLFSVGFFCFKFTVILERWQKTALLFLSALALSVGKKMNVLFVRLAFLVQMFNFTTISALCTTVAV